MDSKRKKDCLLVTLWAILIITWILSVTHEVMEVPTSGVFLIMVVVTTFKHRSYLIKKGEY